MLFRSGSRAHADGNPKLGYMATFPIPEELRLGNAIMLGAKVTCPECTMDVRFINTWHDPQKEREAAASLFDAGAVPFEDVEDGVAGFIFAGALASFDAFAETADRFSAPLVTFAPNEVDGRFGPDFATTAAFGLALCLALIFVRGVAL